MRFISIQVGRCVNVFDIKAAVVKYDRLGLLIELFSLVVTFILWGSSNNLSFWCFIYSLMVFICSLFNFSIIFHRDYYFLG